MISNVQIKNIFEHIGLPVPNDIQPIQSGVVNHTLCVDHKYIVRINVRDPEIRKFKREQLAFKLLKDTSVPVPRLVLLDESQSFVPLDVLITEKLPGENISEFWNACTDDQKRHLACQAGSSLFEIHKTSFPFFGSLEEESKRYSTWTDYIESTLNDHLRNAFDLQIFERSTEVEIRKAFHKIVPLLSQVSESKLVHGDYHFGNIIGSTLGNKPRITGVVDFEWCLAGDPLMDFRNQTNIKNSAKGSDLFVYQGYESASKKPIPWDLRLDFYILLSRLELASVSTRFWLGKIEWGERNHRRIMDTLHSKLHKILES